jgi:hypothetical protein
VPEHQLSHNVSEESFYYYYPIWFVPEGIINWGKSFANANFYFLSIILVQINQIRILTMFQITETQGSSFPLEVTTCPRLSLPLASIQDSLLSPVSEV